MKFATLSNAAGADFVALIDAENQCYWAVSELIPGFDGDMNQLVQSWEQLKSDLVPRTAGRPLSEATLQAPILPQRNLFCVGKNYHEHAAEFSKSGFDSSASFPVTSTLPLPSSASMAAARPMPAPIPAIAIRL